MNGEAFRFLKHQELNSHLTYEGKYAYSDVSLSTTWLELNKTTFCTIIRASS